MPEYWNAGDNVSPALAFFTDSHLCQSGNGIPASGSIRYRLSRISPALPSFAIIINTAGGANLPMSAECSTNTQRRLGVTDIDSMELFCGHWPAIQYNPVKAWRPSRSDGPSTGPPLHAHLHQDGTRHEINNIFCHCQHKQGQIPGYSTGSLANRRSEPQLLSHIQPFRAKAIA
jgi:hypothetical protein